jgi:hypothetical protein
MRLDNHVPVTGAPGVLPNGSRRWRGLEATRCAAAVRHRRALATAAAPTPRQTAQVVSGREAPRGLRSRCPSPGPLNISQSDPSARNALVGARRGQGLGLGRASMSVSSGLTRGALAPQVDHCGPRTARALLSKAGEPAPMPLAYTRPQNHYQAHRRQVYHRTRDPFNLDPSGTH